ncbi:hypothetical protein [Actinosynnema sp. NPDC020468]|uniref:hypothetical protein n=1 Tax=Actinosynnema sp. NPDC020468 TaxID=3154488 RepID=UPI00340B534E
MSVFGPRSITVLELHDQVRKNQHLHFRSGSYTPNEAALSIAAEALLAGAEDVRITSIDGWVGVYADLDWLDGVEETVFTRFLPFPPGGQNAVTAEVLPVVFARGVATATPSRAKVIKGETLGPLAEGLTGWARAVVIEVALA